MSKGAFKIAALYTIAGLLWIALSDRLLDWLSASMDIPFVLFISSIKGFIYVFVTAIILYRLILNHDSKLRVSEKQYRSYFEANPTPMWIYNRRTLNYTAANEAAVAKYGYSRDEFMNMTILDIRPKSDVAKVHATVKALKGTYNDSGVWTHRKKDGTLMEVHITSHIISGGKEEHIMVMATEVPCC